MSTVDTDHGDAGLSVAEYLDEAMENVIECILTHGQWPAPRAKRGNYWMQPQVVKVFDLWDFIAEQISDDDKHEFLYAVTLHSGRYYPPVMSAWQKKVETKLRAHLAGSELVAAEAEKLADEARA